jgi:hypothetical protein
MLVLAMEFSKDAHRAFWAVTTKEQTGAEVQNGRARGRRIHQMASRRHRVGGTESPRAAHGAGTEGHSLKTE